ncbi:DUF5320 domain-containing protein [Labilibaculum antarcticum]|uniref:J domain-containing protein n=1 Tax=Labilibaculum antarcticum TaxID=1717717 RepID=A0A1Y1CEG6_9BACT|nr:DUF5320 domain-containing protein [Labilibaculum antarcticum]BAX78748.1 hypothetical protein ALGA_0353 [Labilibaculum antarcticum]
MLEKKQPISNASEQLFLKEQIEALQKELEVIEQKTNAFESLVRTSLAEELIEEQELRILYKKRQQAKKEKRLEQKKRGKNYKEPIGIKPIIKAKITPSSTEEQKEKKRLYREAMLHVHPDKFSMNEEKIDLATEVTSKLVDIYKAGNLQELQLYHTHIFSGNALNQIIDIYPEARKMIPQDLYLKKEKEQLEELLFTAKNRHTYKVLTEYPDPLLFVEELRDYYADKITKLRKRTRKVKP